MITWIVTAFYVLGIAAAVEAIMTARTAQGAIAWSVSLVSMPFVALPAYLVSGRSKFEGVVEAYDQSKDEIDSVVSDVRENLQPWTASGDERYWTYAAVPKLSGMNLTYGNRVELLINGEATFDSIISGIAQAQEYVLVQFYMFHDDWFDVVSSEDGVFGCIGMMACHDVCPKELPLLEVYSYLRRKMLAAGLRRKNL